MSKKSTKEKFIKTSKEKHGNKYDYSKVIYINNHTKVKIICPIHGEFLQIPNNHRKSGCKFCSNNQKLTNHEFIKRSKEKHDNKYDYSKVNYINVHTKVKIICPIHGEFLQTPKIHLKGHSCPKCSGVGKLNIKEFIKRSKEKHGNKYDYSKVIYINIYTKVKIICSIHGEFLQTPSSHLSDHGCPKCSGNVKLTKNEFIKKAIEIHGNKYDYSKVIYVNSYTKVRIICPIHGEFLQKPNNHLQGCPKCRKFKTTKKFIEKSIEIYGNKYDYSKVKYINNQTKIKIICLIHGEFLQKPKNHLSGIGCLKCVNENNKKKFIEKAIEIHGNKYDYSKVNYIGNNTKVKIICSIHGEFLQKPNNHLNRRQGCPNCSGNIKLTTERFIKKVIEVHGNKYDYSKVKYINNHTKVKIICSTHGEFLQKPLVHLYGHGCPKCGGVGKLNIKEFIKISKEKHGNKYNYSKVNYVSSRTEVKIICPIHGEFLQKPNNHMAGHGCLECSGSKKLTKEEFIKRSKEKHSNKYDYSKVIYVNINTKIEIICPNHGSFFQSPYHHLRGFGCSKCSNLISKPSQAWLDFYNISKENREKTLRINNKWFRVDGYDPKTNTVYEFYGDFWHGNPEKYNPNNINPIVKKTYGELYKKTLKREKVLKSAGYNLVIIWENEWNECKINI